MHPIFLASLHLFQILLNTAKMSAAAKQLLASTPLASVLPSNSLVTVTTGCRLEAAIKTLNEHNILSVPVLKQGVRTWPMRS